MATPAHPTMAMTKTIITSSYLNRPGKQESFLFGPFSKKNTNPKKLHSDFKTVLQCLDFDTSKTTSKDQELYGVSENDHLKTIVFRVSIIGKWFLYYQLKLKDGMLNDQDLVSLQILMKQSSEIGEWLSDKRRKVVDSLFPRLVPSLQRVLESGLEALVYLEESHIFYFLGLLLLLVISLVRYGKNIDRSKRK